MLILYLIKVDELEVRNEYGSEWYRICKKLSKDELRKWSTTRLYDLILRPPLEK